MRNIKLGWLVTYCIDCLIMRSALPTTKAFEALDAALIDIAPAPIKFVICCNAKDIRRFNDEQVKLNPFMD